MKNILFILVIFLSSCGSSSERKVTDPESNTQSGAVPEPVPTLDSAAINVPLPPDTDVFTVEDTVLNQLGGKLYYLNLLPTDKITVIKTNEDIYITHASGIHQFEIIQYTNNTGDLIPGVAAF